MAGRPSVSITHKKAPIISNSMMTNKKGTLKANEPRNGLILDR